MKKKVNIKNKKYRKKPFKKIKHKPQGIIHVIKTETNTISTLTDLKGNTKLWISAGTIGIKGSRKSTVYASEAVARKIAQRTIEFGYRNILIKVKGVGFGKTRAIKTIKKEGLRITHIYECTPTPHNGCTRPRKQRK
uniref:Ribosomal protein S11 n=1 Tax=Symbiochloris sp. SG-2018 TaxID=2126034 RepID=A0A976U634_9CHLO|nr:ribosomal protein S11 [Symbiochloris sp. SG-2018]UVF37887.1 ribosomal protein S11 [Symbiochloris sp. SG-2018]